MVLTKLQSSSLDPTLPTILQGTRCPVSPNIPLPALPSELGTLFGNVRMLTLTMKTSMYLVMVVLTNAHECRYFMICYIASAFICVIDLS